MKISKKKLTVTLIGLLAVALIVGSWAFFTSTSSINNQFTTDKYGAKTIEEFTPNQPMEPGKEITKTVGVTNTGDYGLVVRVKFDESWARAGTVFQAIDSTGPINTVTHTAGTTEWLATQAGTDGATDGLTAGDETVVYKNLDLTNWTLGSDGYYYYNAVLGSGQNTGYLLNSIIMASNADIGKYITTTYYSTTPKATMEALLADPTKTDAEIQAAYAWTTTEPADPSTITYIQTDTTLDPNASGYANADYTLTVTTEVCQATADAVSSEWAMTAADLQTILTGWALS